jgi:hypothetical protein
MINQNRSLGLRLLTDAAPVFFAKGGSSKGACSV